MRTEHSLLPEEFCRREHPALVRAMTAYTGDPDLAVELAQEALARAYRDWSSVSRMDAPGAWAYRVAANLANSHFRRRRYERLARERAASRAPVAWHDQLPAVAAEPRVLEALSALPRRQREAVALRFLLDLSVEQAAEHMGAAPGTVRALTAQAIARLREDPSLAALQEDPHA